MGDGFTVDASDFSRLSADLGRVPSASGKNLRKAIEVTARNVRDTWREHASGLAHAPAFPYSITYDIEGAGSQLEAEIGPDKDRPQGALGNLLEYGSINNAGFGFGHGALQANEADFEKGIDLAVGDALKGLGL